MRILALSKYSQLGASSRVRMFQYVNELRSRGLHVTTAPLLSDDYIMRLYSGQSKQWSSVFLAYATRLRTLVAAARAFDLIWLEKEFFPFVPAMLEEALTDRRVPYVVDYDDAIFHQYETHRSATVRYMLSRKIDSVMARADCVVAGNDYLASRARSVGAKRVEQLPTVINLNRYATTPLPPGPPFVIGWIGTPQTAHYLRLIAPALQQVCRRISAEVLTVGASKIELGVPVRDIAWSEQTEAESISKFHVGIMPLPDESFERGKCGYKLIQCMAAARPVIGSRVGVNCHIIDDGLNGFLAGSAHEWTEALLKLHENALLGQQMGAAARVTVETHYCVQVTVAKLAAIFESVVGGRNRRDHSPKRGTRKPPWDVRKDIRQQQATSAFLQGIETCG